jgi:hypothetical protein
MYILILRISIHVESKNLFIVCLLPPLAEAAKVARFRDEMNATERAMTVLRAQLTVCADQATRKQNELQNSLQASRQFLDEVRLEYEDYAETTKSEFELYRAAKTHEIRMVRQVRRNRSALLISHYCI